LLLGVSVLSGVAASLYTLVQNEQPYVGYDSTATQIDGEAVFLGEALFQDPSAGYTGLPLPPLFPLVLGALDHVHLWSGWGALLSICSGLALSAMAARLAYRPTGGETGERLAAAAGALGMAGVAWWLALFVPFNFLYTSRSDQLAWALGIGGLLLLPRVERGSRRALAAAALLVSAAFWAKQPAAAAALAALVWLALRALRGGSWTRLAQFGAALAALNGLVLLALWVATSGWAGTFVFEIPASELRDQQLLDGVGELLNSAGPAAVVAAALWLGCAWARRLEQRPAEAAPGEPSVSVLVTFVALGSVLAVLSDLKQGSVHNQFIGVAWGLALLAAIAWGRGLGLRRALSVTALVVVGLFGASHVDRVRAALHARLNVNMPPARLSAFWYPVSPQLRAWAAERRVYHPVYSDLNVAPRGEIYPSHVHIQDLLATGRQPTWLVRQFLDRRFDAVFLFDENLRFAIYASGAGRHEERYLWKLNEVIRARYRPDPSLPRVIRQSRLLPNDDYSSPGVLVRRPGPEPATWMRHCFGPFRVGGAVWEIGRGGGFWCARPGGTVLRLRDTPAPVSEIRTTSPPRALHGRLAVELAVGRGFAEVACGSGDAGWRLRLRERGEGVEVALLEADRLVAAASLDAPGAGGARTRLRASLELSSAAGAPALEAGGRRLRAPLDGCDSLSLRGSRDSGAAFDVGGLAVG